MDPRRPLREALNRWVPQPTLQQALNCFEVYKIQNAAIEVAEFIREHAIEVCTQRELDNKPPLNWRKFYVAAVGVGVIPISHERDRYNWQVRYGWNTKPHPNEPKFCAERRVGRGLIRKGCSCVVALAIVAETNPGGDGRSGKHGPNDTLDMCETCRDDGRGEFRGLYCGETLVLNYNIRTRKRCVRPIPEVFAHHDEAWLPPNVVKLHRKSA